MRRKVKFQAAADTVHKLWYNRGNIQDFQSRRQFSGNFCDSGGKRKKDNKKRIERNYDVCGKKVSISAIGSIPK